MCTWLVLVRWVGWVGWAWWLRGCKWIGLLEWSDWNWWIRNTGRLRGVWEGT